MGSLSDDTLDEAHCLWALCPHPCCWETEQRIAKGIYRRAVRKPTKRCTPFQEMLPSLTVVNVSEWAGRRKRSGGKGLYKSTSLENSDSEGYLHKIACFPVLPQRENSQGFESTDSSGIRSAPSTSQASGIKDKAVKLNTMQISPLIASESPWGSGSLVLWVPNPHYIPQGFAQKRSKSPKYAVKELVCLPACPLQASKVKENPKGMKKKVSFQLARSPSHFRGEAGSSSPGHIDAASGSSPIREGWRHNTGSSTDDPSSALRSETSPEREANSENSTLLLRNRPVVFHKVQEKGVKKASKGGPASFYKMDSKTGEERVDWDGLRRQAYLWRKHNLPQNKDGKVTVYPPGGAIVSQEDFCPIPKVSLHLPFHRSLPVAPAVWNNVNGIWRYEQCRRPLMSQSKCLHSIGTDTLPSVHSSSSVVSHSSLRKMSDTDVTEEGIKGAVTPFNSLLSCQHLNQDGVSEGAEVAGQVAQSFPEDFDQSVNSSLTLSCVAGAVEPWRHTRSAGTDPETAGYRMSTPPPSLR